MTTPRQTPRKQITDGSTPVAGPSRTPTGQVVLDEDAYTAALEHIIARDFFPSLVFPDVSSAHPIADAAATPATVRRRGWETTPVVSGPSDTPLFHSTTTGANTDDDTNDGSETRAAKRARIDAAETYSNLRLDAFQAAYTSEDNASFAAVLDEDNRRRRERHAWAWDAQRRVEAQRAKSIKVRERALIEPAGMPGVREKMRIGAAVPVGLITAGDGDGESGEGEGAVVVAAKGKERAEDEEDEEEEEAQDVMAPKKDTRPAGVDGWHFRARNSLMFAPDADVASHDARRPPPSARAGAAKAIEHGNTRLPDASREPTAVSMSAPPSPTRSRIDAAISGTPYRPRSPGVRNFSYVPAMPSPTPSELGPAAVKQLMTTGTLLGTPRVLARSGDEDKGLPHAEPGTTPFRIVAPTAREALSHRLSTTAARSLRAKTAMMSGSKTTTPIGRRQGGGGDMGPPVMTPRRADAPGALTPAARRLLDRSTVGTVAAARRAEAMERTAGWDGRKRDLERVRWTPTPSPVGRR